MEGASLMGLLNTSVSWGGLGVDGHGRGLRGAGEEGVRGTGIEDPVSSAGGCEERVSGAGSCINQQTISPLRRLHRGKINTQPT